MASKIKFYKSQDFDYSDDETCSESKDSNNMHDIESSTDTEMEYVVDNLSTYGKRLSSENGDLSRRSQRTTTNNKQIARLPTRRPNPKISNRNALLARENRRRKKELMDKLEGDLESLRAQNKKFRKMLKVKDDNIQRLDREKAYLRSIIANQTAIVGMIRSFRSSKLPMTSSLINYTTKDSISDTKLRHDSDYCSSTSSAGSSTSPNYQENGTVINADPLLSDSFNLENFISTDCFNLPADKTDLNDVECTSMDRWDNNFTNFDKNYNFVEDISKLKDNELLCTPQSKTDHDYSETGRSADSGVCFHVSNGRVSLEFCADCHLNSENAWMEEF